MASKRTIIRHNFNIVFENMYKSIYKTFFEKNKKGFNRWKDMHYFGIRKKYYIEINSL